MLQALTISLDKLFQISIMLYAKLYVRISRLHWGNATHHHIDLMSMCCWITSPFYDFCCFRRALVFSENLLSCTPLFYEMQFRAKLHYTDTSYGHWLRTPPTDELTTILQLVVQQIHHQRTKISHIPTSWHVEILGSGIEMWQNFVVDLLWARPLVVSVGGVVQHVRIAGVRVVEFGPYWI